MHLHLRVRHKPAHRRPPGRGGLILAAFMLLALAAGLIPALAGRVPAPRAAQQALTAAAVPLAAPSGPLRPARPALSPAARTALRTYTVRPGDYLSAIALRLCGHANDWAGLYAANRHLIGTDPDLIFPGQRLAVTRCADPPALLRLAARPAARPDGDRDRDSGHGSARSGSGARMSDPGTAPYRGSGTLSAAQVGSLWLAEGGPASQLGTAECVAMHESSGEPWQTGQAGEIGLFQLMPSHPDASYNPAVNTRGAVLLWESQGWWPWTTYTHYCGG